jgi:hypothetical protein
MQTTLVISVAAVCIIVAVRSVHGAWQRYLFATDALFRSRLIEP